MPGGSGRDRWAAVRLAVLVAVVAVVGVTAAVIGVDDLVDRLDDLSGPVGAVAFAAAYAVAVVVLVPGAALTIAAGAVFGTVAGAAVAVLGAGVGAVASYSIARLAGRSAVERLAGPRTRRLDGWVADRQLRSMLLLRLVPLIPFGPLNYSAGLSSVRPLPYAVATFVGIVPGALVYANVGATGRDPASPQFAAALGLLAALTLVSSLLARRLRGPAASTSPATAADDPGT